jgi:hypothetical protein
MEVSTTNLAVLNFPCLLLGFNIMIIINVAHTVPDLRHSNDPSLVNKRGNNGGRLASHSTVARQDPPRSYPGVVEKVQPRRLELARQEPPMRQANPQTLQSSSLQAKPRGALNKQSNNPSSYESGPGRPVKAAQQRPFGDMKPKQTREHLAVERKPMASQTYVSTRNSGTCF